MTSDQTVTIVEDAIAFTKAADRCAMVESTFRKACAALGAVCTPDQIVRICAAARAHQLVGEARARRNNARRKKP